MLDFIKKLFSRHTDNIEPIVDSYRIKEVVDGFMLEHWEHVYDYDEEEWVLDWNVVAGSFDSITAAEETHRIIAHPTIKYL